MKESEQIMTPPKNRPYVKMYGEDGKTVINPINGFYPSPFPNRKLRRSKVGRKTHGKMTVLPIGMGKFVKYVSYLQYIPEKKILGDLNEFFEFEVKRVIPARTVQHYKEV